MSKKVQKNFQTMAKDLSDFGKKFSLYVTTPLAAGAAISVRNADVQIQAEAKLLKALNGRADIQRRLIEQAAQLQNQSTVGDETIIKQQAYFASLGLTEEQIRKATEASVEMEAVFGDMGINMESAAKSIGVMFGGLLGELGEKIPQLKQFTAEELKAGKGLEYLLETYGGTAKYMAGEGLNPVKQMQNALGDLSEEIGKEMIPFVQTGSRYLQSMIQWLQQLPPSTKTTVVALGGLAAAIGPVSLGLGALIRMAPMLKTGLLSLISPMGLITAGLMAVASAAVMAYAKVGELYDRQSQARVQSYTGGQYSIDDLKKLREEYQQKLNEDNKLLATERTKLFVSGGRPMLKSVVSTAGAEQWVGDKETGMARYPGDYALASDVKTSRDYNERVLADIDAAIRTLELQRDLADVTAAGQPNVVAPSSEEEIQAAEGSIKVLRIELNALQDAYDGAATSAERYRFAAQMKRVEQSLNMAMADGTGTVVRPAGTAELFRNTFESVGSVSFDPSVLAGSREKWAAAGQAIRSNLQIISSQALEYMDQFNQMLSSGLSNLAVSLAEGIGEAFGGMGIESLGDNIIVAVGNLISSLGALLITYATTMKEFKIALGGAFASPPLALAIGAAMVVTGTAMAAAIKNKAQKGVALAEGGLAFGPTMALVGDNRGAGSDPEVIAPLSKLRQYGLGANDVRVSGRFVVNGSDLLLVLDREKSRQQRMNG